ncbi:MAG: hypothetical protein GY754_04720 [bacterium]|nr:hypothetical protein [bacterium]
MHKFPYQMQDTTTGLFIEILLPKKLKYQPILYDILRRGLKFENVKEHLLDENKNEKIQSFVGKYNISQRIDRKKIEEMKHIFWGYSIYEVDGAFSDSNIGSQFIEERTQIIRIMFLPDFASMKEEQHIDLSEKEINKIIQQYLKVERHLDKKIEKTYIEKVIIEYLERWIDDVRLFLFCYFVFEICNRINQLKEKDKEPLEKEIWVTSFWDVSVNKALLID